MLKPKLLPPIPDETKRLGEALYAPENIYRQIGDVFADAIRDEQFAEMYSTLGQPALSPAVLSLVSILQFLEHLSDRQTIVMLRSRIDWKYALHLDLDFAGFDSSVLCEFRQRLGTQGAQRLIFESLLAKLKAEGLLKGRHLQRSDSLVIVSAARQLNRLELVVETMRLALEAIAERDAEWLGTRMPVDWLEVYGEWAQAERLVKETGERGQARTRELMVSVGKDGFEVLDWLAAGGPEWEQDPAAVTRLGEVWRQQFRRRAPDGIELSTPETRADDGVGGEMITTPHDEQVRYRAKGKGEEGYKLHLTETADEQGPTLITDLDVVKLTEYEGDAVEAIQQRLIERDLAPEQHLVDRGYVDGTTLGESQRRGIELVGPMRENWGGRVGGTQAEPRGEEPVEPDEGGHLKASQFELDAERKVGTCPAGQASASWHERERKDARRAGIVMLYVSWSATVCRACPLKERCLNATSGGRRLQVNPNQQQIEQRRSEQHTAEFQRVYRRRAGVEATFSALRRSQGRRARYRGRDKILFQYAAAATAMNLRRVAAHKAGTEVVRNRASRLRRLMGEVAAMAKGWGQNLASRLPKGS